MKKGSRTRHQQCGKVDRLEHGGYFGLEEAGASRCVLRRASQRVRGAAERWALMQLFLNLTQKQNRCMTDLAHL